MARGYSSDIRKPDLEAFIADGLTLAQMGERLGVSASTVHRWMRLYGLRAKHSHRRAEALAALRRGEGHIVGVCARHGRTEFSVLRDGRSRCMKCNSAAVARYRRRQKELLIADAGGGCALCGYDRCAAALHFHHLDPPAKVHGIAEAGASRSLARARAEVKKCVLLCANCHAEVEVGLTTLPLELRAITDPG